MSNAPFVPDAIAQEALENAGRLYDRYVELAKLAERRALSEWSVPVASATFGSLNTGLRVTHANVE